MSFNAVMSALKTLMSIIFPLITFPYASNVLQVENLGKVNFASSVCGYFLLFAGLGISSYAVREGSRYVNDREKLSAFASEMFSINMISTALTYAALAVTMLFWTKLHAYTDLMLVLSLQIFFTTIGTEWVFTIFEEYTYITIRGLLFQVLSIFMLFAFVKTRDDYCIYAGITVFAAVGANVLNFFRARRYCTIRLTRKIDWKKHLKPILIIFASTLATTLYVSSDTTILGILGTDYNVGIYSVAGKIYGIVKNLLSAVLVVSIPRLSHYVGVGDKANFNKLFNSIFNALIVVVAPAVVGLFALSREVVLFISGKSYLDAVMPLQILSLALIVCLFGWLYNSCALLPCGREKELFWITLVSGLLNVGLNILLIPRFRENAAAFTTLLAELCSMMLCIRCSRGLVTVSADRRTVGSVLCGCAGIVLVCTGVKALALPNLICILAAVLAVCVRISRVGIKSLVRGLKPVVFIIVFTGILNLFFTPGEHILAELGFLRISAEGLQNAVFMVLRIMLLIMGTFLMTYTTSPISLTDGLERLLGGLKKIHVPVHELAMIMSIALRFIPTLIEETDKIMSAQKARGADFESGNIIQKAKALIPILVPLFISAFRRADELAVAMECRCYHGGEGRTRLRQLIFVRRDYLALALGLAVTAGIIVLRQFT